MRARRLLSFLVVAALLGAVAACGLSENSEPRAIPVDNVLPELLDPEISTTSTTLVGTPVTVYLLEPVGDGETVVAPVRREVADPLSAELRIGALLAAQPTEPEVAQGLFNAIPSDLSLRSAEIDSTGELVIDLSDELFSLQGSGLTQVFAQIVWTVAELDGVRSVRFQVDGEDETARDAEGGEQRSVDIGDYASMAPVP